MTTLVHSDNNVWHSDKIEPLMNFKDTKVMVKEVTVDEWCVLLQCLLQCGTGSIVKQLYIKYCIICEMLPHMKNFQSSRQPCFQLCLQLQKASYTGCSTCPVTGFAMITSYTVTVQISLALSTVVCNDEFTTYWCDQNKVLMSKTMHTSATELTNTPYYSISRHRILLQS